jgi:5-methylcytosine-specific restriction endonuclease McrA
MTAKEAWAKFYSFINSAKQPLKMVYRSKTNRCYMQAPSGFAKVVKGGEVKNSLPPFSEELFTAFQEQQKALIKTAKILQAAENRSQKKIAREADYKAYLKSPEWRDKKRLIVQRAILQQFLKWLYRKMILGIEEPFEAVAICELCGKKIYEQVHHLTYERLGDEWLDDLRAACQPCHDLNHVDKVFKE